MFRAIDNLVMLGVIEGESGDLSSLGKVMSMFPLEPKYTKVLFAAAKRKCLDAALSIISVMTSGNWKLRDKSNDFIADSKQKKFLDPNGCDLMSIVNVVRAFTQSTDKFLFCKSNFINFRTLNVSQNVKKQLIRILQRCPSKGYSIDFTDSKQDYHTESINIKKCFLEGFYQNIAHLQKSGTYQVLKENHLVLIHPSSALKSKCEFVLYLEFVLTSKNFIRMVTKIEPNWLIEMFEHFYSPEKVPNPEAKKIFKQLILKKNMIKNK
jgi:HrpA-like RNA helicase